MSTEITELQDEKHPRVNGRFIEVPLTAASSYFAKHSKVKHTRGPASQFLCADGCGRQAQDWATIHGHDDGLDLWADYQPMARRCHMLYDGNLLCWRRGEDVAGAKLTRANVLELRELYATGELTRQQLAAKYGVSSSTVYDVVIRNKTWQWLT